MKKIISMIAAAAMVAGLRGRDHLGVGDGDPSANGSW
jgi:hypothetical protein